MKVIFVRKSAEGDSSAMLHNLPKTDRKGIGLSRSNHDYSERTMVAPGKFKYKYDTDGDGKDNYNDKKEKQSPIAPEGQKASAAEVPETSFDEVLTLIASDEELSKFKEDVTEEDVENVKNAIEAEGSSDITAGSIVSYLKDVYSSIEGKDVSSDETVKQQFLDKLGKISTQPASTTNDLNDEPSNDEEEVSYLSQVLNVPESSLSKLSNDELEQAISILKRLQSSQTRKSIR